MLHGVTVSECCGLLGRHVVDGELVIEEQYIQRKGKGVRTKELKRPRRYRRVPIAPTLLPELEGLPATHPIIERRVTKKRKGPHPMERTSLGRAISRAVEGTKFEGISPHDLRSSGAKWMLDAGAKLSDVAAILGNDPRVLLAHYDQPDDGGKRRAVGVL